MMKKWRAETILGYQDANRPTIIWARNGVADLGEPFTVRRKETYPTIAARDKQIFKGPIFAKGKI